MEAPPPLEQEGEQGARWATSRLCDYIQPEVGSSSSPAVRTPNPSLLHQH